MEAHRGDQAKGRARLGGHPEHDHLPDPSAVGVALHRPHVRRGRRLVLCRPLPPSRVRQSGRLPQARSRLPAAWPRVAAALRLSPAVFAGADQDAQARHGRAGLCLGQAGEDGQRQAAYRHTSREAGAVSPVTPKPALDMSVNVAGIGLKNPVLAAAGSFAYGVEFEDVVTLSKLGGFVTKGLSREPMPGNPPPRLFETAAGMLNAIGLQNIGARAFLEEKLPILRKIDDIVFLCNVFGHTQDEYEDVVRILNDGEGIAGYELNVSCPNTKCGGISFGSNPKMLFDVVSAVKKIAARPLIVKLSPNVTSIPEVARAGEEAGADAISLVNTFVAMAIDAETRKPRISNITAGLSGPAI